MSAAYGDGGRGRKPSKSRLQMSTVERVLEQLSARDWDIIHTLHRLHLATGSQLERLHFISLHSKRSRNVIRGRALKRLVDTHVLTTLDIRVAVAGHNSGELCYTLDAIGYRVLQIQSNRETPDVRIRRPWLPGDRFVRHTLAVTELYVALAERARLDEFILSAFQAKQDAYWPNGPGSWLRPDAFVQLRHAKAADYWQYWWFEADMGTESLPTLRAKLLTYLDFVQRGQLGPDDVVPRVMVGVLTSKRQAAIEVQLDGLPSPAAELFQVADLTDVAQVMADKITNE